MSSTAAATSVPTRAARLSHQLAAAAGHSAHGSGGVAASVRDPLRGLAVAVVAAGCTVGKPGDRYPDAWSTAPDQQTHANWHRSVSEQILVQMHHAQSITLESLVFASVMFVQKISKMRMYMIFSGPNVLTFQTCTWKIGAFVTAWPRQWPGAQVLYLREVFDDVFI